jgi:two-component sensor histidine kinase
MVTPPVGSAFRDAPDKTQARHFPSGSVKNILAETAGPPERAMDTDDLYRLLRNAHLQAQGVIDTLNDPMVVLDRDLCVTNASAAFYEKFGVVRDDTVGQSFYELGDGQWNIPELRELLETIIPKSASVTNYEVRGEFPGLGRRTMLVTARRLVHPDHHSRVILLSIVDATEQRWLEDTQNTVIAELRHRIKNILAVVASLARLTRVKDRTSQEFQEDFLGRLDALVRANGFATDAEGVGQLSELVRATLEPYGAHGDRVELGQVPDVSLAQEQVVPISLVLHELATNAAKYGALSAPDGRLRIGWSVERSEGQADFLNLTWSETGGPAVSPPEKQGFGTRLIDFAIARDLGGSLDRAYEQDGLRVEARFPL